MNELFHAKFINGESITIMFSFYNIISFQNMKSVHMYIVVDELTLRKHAYSNIQKISSPKTENFQMKTSDIFSISAQNIDCGYSLEPPRWGGSNEFPQSMF